MRVIVIDDDPLVSGALKVILEGDCEGGENDGITVAAMGCSGAEAVSLYKAHRPDIVVMDIRMDNMNGIEAASAILSCDEDARILFLTTFVDDEYISRALRMGARGYILKQDCAGLASACRAVMRGQMVYGSKVVEKLPDIINRKAEFDYGAYGITAKETELIGLVADGLSNREIAARMFIAEGTVRNLISSVLGKLNLRDRTQLACFYYQQINP